jgi:anti-anti-sigma regulatory factor
MKVASLHPLKEATRDAARSWCAHATDTREPWPVAIFGVPVDPLTAEAAAARVSALVGTGVPRCVWTADTGLLLRAWRESGLRRELADADLVLAESRTVAAASHCLRNPLPGVVNGDELARRVVQLAAARGLRLVLANVPGPGSAEVIVRLRREFPRLDVDIACTGPGHTSDAQVRTRSATERIAEADVVLAGPPADTSAALPAGSRAVVVRLCRTPELFLPCSNGRRGGRTGAGDCARAALAVLAAACGWLVPARRLSGAPVAASVSGAADRWVDIDGGASLTRSRLDANAALWRSAEMREGHCTLDLSRIDRVDATGLGVLLRWRAHLRRHGRLLVLVAPSAPVLAALARGRAGALFETQPTRNDAHQLAPPAGRIGTACTRCLAWCGEVMAANTDDVWGMTEEYVRTFAASGATLVIIDLARLRFIDSAGAQLMLRVKQWSRDISTPVLFARPQPHVRNVLHLAELDVLVLEGAK